MLWHLNLHRFVIGPLTRNNLIINRKMVPDISDPLLDRIWHGLRDFLLLCRGLCLPGLHVALLAYLK